MTMGANNFADAPVIDYNSMSDPTPSAGLTTEPGEPDVGGFFSTGHTAWWKFTAPATETVGIDTLYTNRLGLDPGDPAAVWNYDTLIDVYTGTSLGSLVRVAEGNDNNRLASPTNPDFYPFGYLTEMDFEATLGTTYYVRVSCYTSSSDMEYVLRLGQRTFTYGPWNARPDMYIPLEMSNLDNWSYHSNETWTGYQGFQHIFVTAWPGTPSSAGVEAAVDASVADAAATTYLANEGVWGIDGSTGEVTVAQNISVNFRPDPIGPGLIHDIETDTSGFAFGFGRTPKGALLGGAAEALIPWNDPDAWGVDYSHDAAPAIDSTFVIDRWQTYWQPTVQSVVIGEPEGIISHPAVSGTVEYQVLVGDFGPADVTGVLSGRPPWDLNTGVPFAHFDYTGSLETIDRTVTTTVPGAVQADGSFCFVMKLLSVGDLLGGMSTVANARVETGPTWYTASQSWSPELDPAPMTVTYLVRDIADWRYVYPHIGPMGGVLKVMVDPGGATEIDRWQSWGFPNETPGAGKVMADDGWHVADDDAATVSGHFKIMDALRQWQHVSWMSPS